MSFIAVIMICLGAVFCFITGQFPFHEDRSKHKKIDILVVLIPTPVIASFFVSPKFDEFILTLPAFLIMSAVGLLKGYCKYNNRNKGS